MTSLRVSDPARMLEVVPSVLGYQPGEPSLVVLCCGQENRIKVAMRLDLSDPANADAARIAEGVEHAVTANQIRTVHVIGYGTMEAVGSSVEAVRGIFPPVVVGALRVVGNRFWVFDACDKPECCPPEGRKFDPAVVLPGATVIGSRDELRQSIAADHSNDLAMCKAIVAAVPVIRDVAIADMEAVIGEYRASDDAALALDRAATFLAGLRQLRIRDHVWSMLDPEHNAAHKRLFVDLVRVAPAGFVAPPASLLAFLAWQRGDGAMANIALDRADADDPEYSMASLIRDAVNAGAPPSVARLPMTPDEVDASYAEMDKNNADQN